MASHRAARRPAASPVAARTGVTPERFRRLYQLLHLVAQRPITRDTLARRLKLDVRGFYRDLEVLRAAGIVVSLDDGRYRLIEPLAEALNRLPFPDPLLTFGEARQLARGTSAAHKRLRALLTGME